MLNLNALTYPAINGERYDWSSVEIFFDGVPFGGVKELTYRDSLRFQKIRGNGYSQAIGRTRGEYDAEGSMSMYKLEFQELLKVFMLRKRGLGWMEASFDVLAAYSPGLSLPGAPGFVSVTRLNGCRFTSCDETGSEGSDALVVRCDIDILSIERDGQSALTKLRT